MAWISVHNTIFGRKLRSLEKKTGRCETECIGALAKLWMWGLENATKDGEITDADKQDVADVLYGKVTYDPLRFVDAMVDTGWIDWVDGKLFFHDWEVWQAPWYKALSKRENDRKRKKGGVADDDDSTEEPVPTDEYPPEFEELWDAYPRKLDKGAAYKKYLARIHEGYKHEDLLEATIAYSTVVKRKGTQKEYIKHGSTFFGPSKPFLDYVSKKEEKTREPVDDGKNPFRSS